MSKNLQKLFCETRNSFLKKTIRDERVDSGEVWRLKSLPFLTQIGIKTFMTGSSSLETGRIKAVRTEDNARLKRTNIVGILNQSLRNSSK